MRRAAIRLREVPDELLDQFIERLQHFTATLVAFAPNADAVPLVPAGSGTFVEVDGVHAILTAQHVWEEAKRGEQVLMTISTKPNAFAIPVRDFEPLEIRDRRDEHWGPDLALLQLPPVHVSTIKATKSFLNLAKQRMTVDARAAAARSCLWAVVGMVGETTAVDPILETKTANLHIDLRAFVGAPEEQHQRGEWDYVDIGADLNSPKVPSSFGGISGGGLWQLPIQIDRDKKIIWDQRTYFAGVAFSQSYPANDRRIVRCHGPKSIFETAWAKWGLPTK